MKFQWPRFCSPKSEDDNTQIHANDPIVPIKDIEPPPPDLIPRKKGTDWSVRALDGQLSTLPVREGNETKEANRQLREVERRLQEAQWRLQRVERKLEESEREAEIMRNRHARLQNGERMTLFHQTSKHAAEKIRKSGKMQRGSCGRAGGGMYFATSRTDTTKKAHARGSIVVASVRLGKVKTLSRRGDPSITFESLIEEGFDSVMIPRSNGDEYVVYNHDQVTLLEVDEDRWWLS